MTTTDTSIGLHLLQLQIRLAGDTLVDLDTCIAPGEILTVMGSSGSGKSTLLAAIAGTLAPEFSMTGSVVLDGRVLGGLPTQRRRVGLMFQDDLLFPHLSVASNLLFALPPAVKGREERRRRVELALAQADLKGFGARDPATLSGGQRARVALMRTLMAAPAVLLLDEPFARLDQELRVSFRSFVFGLARSRALPVLLVTHDREDAKAAGGLVLTTQGLALKS